MIFRLADHIVKLFIQERIILQDEQELYMYCFQTVFFQMVTYGSILLMAIYMKYVTMTGAYYFGFLSIRYVAGGYHAKSRRACFTLSIIIYLLSMGLLISLTDFSAKLLILAGSLCSICMIFWAAPVDHRNRPFSPREKERYKKKSHQVTFLVTMVAIIVLNVSIDLAAAIVLGTFCAACSVWIGQRQRRRELLC